MIKEIKAEPYADWREWGNAVDWANSFVLASEC